MVCHGAFCQEFSDNQQTLLSAMSGSGESDYNEHLCYSFQLWAVLRLQIQFWQARYAWGPCGPVAEGTAPQKWGTCLAEEV